MALRRIKRFCSFSSLIDQRGGIRTLNIVGVMLLVSHVLDFEHKFDSLLFFCFFFNIIQLSVRILRCYFK